VVVVIASPTGVVYQHQCAGIACEARQVEGYLVPLGGLKFDADAGSINAAEFTRLFHAGESCAYGSGAALPPDRLSGLRSLVASVTFWDIAEDGEVKARTHLELDEARLSELAEAWVPVITPAGSGILMWNNCD
jgi:hypothetical protein